MKKQLLFFLFVMFSVLNYAQTWTPEQFAAASTAKDVEGLTQVEKDAIMYINLVRLYPKLFEQIEVEPCLKSGSSGGYPVLASYVRSLKKTLKAMEPAKALVFDKDLYELAKCWAKESGTKGLTGHKRKKCPKGNFAECCSYGMTTGQSIAMQWLIDSKVSSLGHRKICLNPVYSTIGLSIHDHKKYGTCAVADLMR